MSGDGVAGGAFTTGFVVVGRADDGQHHLRPARLPGRSAAPVHGARRQPGQALLDPGARGQPEHSPPANPDPRPQRRAEQQPVTSSRASTRPYDRNGNGGSTARPSTPPRNWRFSGPVVVVALPGTPQRDPITGMVSQQTFVLQAPAGSNPTINNASASVPFDTTLVFAAGSTLKFQNASLFVQNQGSA